MEKLGHEMRPTGQLNLVVSRRLGDLRIRKSPSLWWKAKSYAARWREPAPRAVYLLLGKVFSLVYVESKLSLKVFHDDGSYTDYGVVSRRLVTDAGVAFIVDALHASATIANLKYHGFGTGTTNEAAADTALVTELTTQYATDNTRPTGSQTEGATANIYRTVGTLSPDTGGTIAITEHGIFDQAANSGGTLLDRSKFSAVNLVAGSDSLQATYDLTLTSGG